VEKFYFMPSTNLKLLSQREGNLTNGYDFCKIYNFITAAVVIARPGHQKKKLITVIHLSI
jgi:hypothetical protein